jgi:ABC-type Fe3+-hydroxamate transport system substrate-binding protein
VQIFQSFKDQIGNSVIIPWPPSRIVSLVPSQTELLSDLNLSAQVVGITKYCVWPTQWKKTKVCVGGTKDFNVEKILNLNPDLVIGNKEENQKELIEQLLKHVPLWMSDIETLGTQ